MSESLQSRIHALLDRAPDRRAITFYDSDGRWDWLSLEEFHRRGARLASRLADRGLGRGDVCVIVLPSGELSATTLMAVLLLGAVPLLVAPPVVVGSLLDLPRILKRTIGKTGAKLVICAETMTSMREDLEKGRRGTQFLFGLDDSHTRPGPADLPRVSPDQTDVAAMQLTSGTTGFPRVCMWDHRAVLAALGGMWAAMKLSQDDVCFNWTPLYHDMGLVNNFFLCMTSGVPMVLLNPDDFVRRPALWFLGLADAGATVSWSPNFGFALATQRIRDEEIETVRLDGVRGIWNAAERIHLDTFVAFRERFERYGLRPEACKTNFGCAENIGGATFSDADGRFVVEHLDASVLQEQRIARPVPGGKDADGVMSIVGIGRPHPGIEIEILSATGKPLPEGHAGEIGLRTPSRMLGYLKDARATRRAFCGDLLRTGDLGYRRGKEIFWVGRVKERITVRGKKLDPSDFEPVLFDIEGLRQGCFVAFGVDDAKQGTQRIVVVSEVREPLSRAVGEIRAEIQKQTFLRLGVTVNEVVLVRPRTLAKTSSGKRRHRHFSRLYAEGQLAPFVVKSGS